MRSLRTRFLRPLLGSAILVAALSVSAAAQRFLADVTGKWTMTLAGPDGAIESAVVLKQESEGLSGTIGSQFGTSKLTGTVKSDTVQFTYSIDVQGMQFELRASGMVKDKDNISGNLAAPNGMGNFPFTMKRVP